MHKGGQETTARSVTRRRDILLIRWLAYRMPMIGRRPAWMFNANASVVYLCQRRGKFTGSL